MALRLLYRKSRQLWTSKSLPATNMDYKVEGNRYFEQKEYEKALECYTKGLESLDDPELRQQILSNRSLTYLNLEYFHRAHEDAETLLRYDPLHLKGNYRKIRALIGVGDYEKAHEFLQESSESLNLDLRQDLKDTLGELLDQKRNGSYDIPYIIDKSFDDPEVSFFGKLAHNYQCSSFEIGEVGGGRGRGLIATADILPGTLIMACRSFALTSFVPHTSAKDPQETLIDIIEKKLMIEPERCKELYYLYAGNETSPSYLNGPIYGADFSSDDVCRNRIAKIIKYNAFDYSNNFGARKVGVWILPALLNNECLDSNCKFDIWGDFMFIRAIRPIVKGQELVHTYTLFKDFDGENSELQGFQCDCRLCQMEENEGQLEIRTELKMKLKKAQLVGDIAAMEEILDERRRQAPSPEMQIRLLPHYMRLGNVLFSQKQDLERASAQFEKILDILRETNYVSAYSVRSLINLLLCSILAKKKRKTGVGEGDGGNAEELMEERVKELKRGLEIHFGTTKVMRIFQKWALYKREMGEIVTLIENEHIE